MKYVDPKVVKYLENTYKSFSELFLAAGGEKEFKFWFQLPAITDISYNKDEIIPISFNENELVPNICCAKYITSVTVDKVVDAIRVSAIDVDNYYVDIPVEEMYDYFLNGDAVIYEDDDEMSFENVPIMLDKSGKFTVKILATVIRNRYGELVAMYDI